MDIHYILLPWLFILIFTDHYISSSCKFDMSARSGSSQLTVYLFTLVNREREGGNSLIECIEYHWRTTVLERRFSFSRHSLESSSSNECECSHCLSLADLVKHLIDDHLATDDEYWLERISNQISCRHRGQLILFFLVNICLMKLIYCRSSDIIVIGERHRDLWTRFETMIASIFSSQSRWHLLLLSS